MTRRLALRADIGGIRLPRRPVGEKDEAGADVEMPKEYIGAACCVRSVPRCVRCLLTMVGRPRDPFIDGAPRRLGVGSGPWFAHGGSFTRSWCSSPGARGIAAVWRPRGARRSDFVAALGDIVEFLRTREVGHAGGA